MDTVMEKTFKYIPTDQIDGPEKPVRQGMDLNALNELANSIRARGVLNPIEVYKKENGRYSIIHGDRRYLASQKAGLASIPCIVTNAEPDDIEMDRLHENLYREDITPIEEGIYFSYLKNTKAKTNEEIAKMIGKSKSYVEQRLWTLNWDEDIRRDVDNGELTFAQARELMGIRDERKRKQLTKYAKKGGASINTIRGWKQSANTESAAKPPPQMQPSMSTTTNTPTQPPPEPKVMCDFCQQLYPLSQTKYLRICQNCWNIIQSVDEEETK